MQKQNDQDFMTEAGQSSPSPLAGISQSEGAALESWNRLNKMKWTEQRKMNSGKKENEWNVGKKGKWKMEDWKKKTECWKLQGNVLLAVKLLQ